MNKPSLQARVNYWGSVIICTAMGIIIMLGLVCFIGGFR